MFNYEFLFLQLSALQTRGGSN